MKALLVLLVAATLAGCASLSQHQCLQGDWYAIGVGDGQLGMPADRLDRHTRACAQYGVTIDRQLYLEGRAEIRALDRDRDRLRADLSAAQRHLDRLMDEARSLP